MPISKIDTSVIEGCITQWLFKSAFRSTEKIAIVQDEDIVAEPNRIINFEWYSSVQEDKNNLSESIKQNKQEFPFGTIRIIILEHNSKDNNQNNKTICS